MNTLFLAFLFVACLTLSLGAKKISQTDEESFLDALVYGHMWDYREQIFYLNGKAPDKIEAHEYPDNVIRNENLTPAQLSAIRSILAKIDQDIEETEKTRFVINDEGELKVRPKSVLRTIGISHIVKFVWNGELISVELIVNEGKVEICITDFHDSVVLRIKKFCSDDLGNSIVGELQQVGLLNSEKLRSSP